MIAKKIPAHIDSPDGKTYPAWMTNVIQRKAPGAISAIALTVTPVRPSVGFIFGASEAAAICSPSDLRGAEPLDSGPIDKRDSAIRPVAASRMPLQNAANMAECNDHMLIDRAFAYLLVIR